MADVQCPLRAAALISPHEVALVVGDSPLRFYELDLRVSEAVGRLREAGLREGDRIGLFLPPDERMIILLLAVLRLGAVACPLSLRWPRDAVRQALTRLGAAAVIAQAAADPASPWKVLPPDPLLVPGAAVASWNGMQPLDRPATVIFTSGSQGQPKAALQSFGNHYYSARGANANLRLRSGDRWLLALPLCHVGGLGIVFRCLLGGAALVLPAGQPDLHDAVVETKATHVSLVGTQLRRLLDREEWDPAWKSVKAVLLGGGPVAPDLLVEARLRRLPVFYSYGLTEMASQVTTVRPDTPPDRQSTSGAVLRHRQLRVSDAGEILVRGETLFLGYLRDDQSLDPARDDEGWFATGDLGELSPDGYLTVRGRRDNLFISGGENIHPEQIERALQALDGVEQAVVVPVPDAEFGERPAAIVRGDWSASDEWPLRLRERLPGFMIPVAWLPWPDELPEALGNVDRPRLRAYARVAYGGMTS